MDEGGLWKWNVSLSLSLWRLYEGNLFEGLLYWGPRGICQARLWKWASVSTGAPMGERILFRAFERREKFLFLLVEYLFRNLRDM